MRHRVVITGTGVVTSLGKLSTEYALFYSLSFGGHFAFRKYHG